MTQQLTIPEFWSHVVELHYTRPLFTSMYHIKNSEDANDVLRTFINNKQLDLRECFWIILMTNANRVLAVSEVAQGTSKGVQTNIKYIFQLALLVNASALILAHVHPSGNLNFSKTDISETKKIQRLAKVMDITLLDHLVITSESYTSMVQEDIL